MRRFTTKAEMAIATLLLCSGLAAVAQDPTAQTPVAQTRAPQVTTQAVSSDAAQGGSIKGTVVAGTVGKPGGVPLPGVAVTAKNTLTGKQYTTTTDVDGNYAMTIPKNGRYVVRVELAGFAAETHEVILNGGAVILGAAWFSTQLPEVRREMRPIYQEMGIIPPDAATTQ